MAGIRVTYSGLISLAIGLTTILTGLIFTIIVTRRLSPTEFGEWNLIGGLLTYVIVVEPVISYWSTREIPRGLNSGKTAILFSGLFSIICFFIYLSIAYSVSHSTNVKQDILFLGSILVPVIFLNRTLTAINLGSKPHSTSYGILGFEIVKIPVAVFFVYILGLTISGVIISTFIAYMASNIILAIYAREQIRFQIKITFLKKWLRHFWVPFFTSVSNFMFSLDVTIFSVLTGNVTGLAFYAASLTLSNFISQSGMISKALYPKLLESGQEKYFQENLIKLLYFAIPLTALSICFSKPALFILNPVYVTAVPVVIIMSIRAFSYTLSGTFSSSLQGIEKVDVNENLTFRDLIKSKLFFMPLLQMIQYSIYVGSLAIVVILAKSSHSPIELVLYWSLISVGTQIPFTIYQFLLIRKHFKISFDMSIPKYFLIAVVMFGLTYLMSEKFLNYTRSIFKFFPEVLVFVAIGIGGYLLTTFLVDSRTRKLFKSVLYELRRS